MTILNLLLILLSGFLLINFGWLLAMVGIYALLAQALLAILCGAALIAVGVVVWRLFQQRRRKPVPRLTFKQ
jgi:hypothetical protein